MELSWVWMIVVTLMAYYVFVKKIVRKLNGWYYDMKLGNKHGLLPPGDMGWPLIGNLIPFFKDFSSGHPDSFVNNFVFKSKSFLLSSILLFVFILYLHILYQVTNIKIHSISNFIFHFLLF